MIVLGIIITSLALASGFALILTLGVNAYSLDRRPIFEIIFHLYLAYYLFHCVNLAVDLVAQKTWPLEDSLSSGLYIIFYAVIGALSLLILQFLLELLERRPGPLDFWSKRLIPLYYFILLVTAFFRAGDGPVEPFLTAHLWIAGGMPMQLLAHGTMLTAFILRNKFQGPMIGKAIGLIAVVYFCSLPFQFLEGVVYNFTDWRLVPESFRFNSLLLLAWNIAFLYLIIKKIISYKEKGLALNQPVVRLVKDHQLTRREEEILQQIREDKKIGEISEQLYISPRTVEKHLSNIFKKTGIKGLKELRESISSL